MDRSEQLTALKRLRLAQGATPERFEYEAEDLMAHWAVRSGTAAVAYLKRAVNELPKKHSESLSVMFGFTYPKKGLELRREAYAQKIGKALATVKRLEADALEALLDALNAESEPGTVIEFLDWMLEVDPSYQTERDDVERLLREAAGRRAERAQTPASEEHDDIFTPENRAKINYLKAEDAALKASSASNEAREHLKELLVLLRTRYAAIDKQSDEGYMLRDAIKLAHEAVIAL